MGDLQKVLERVQKYLKLSRSDNPHEAAEAARRAREIMTEYQLTEAMLRVDEPTRAAEKIVDGVTLDDAKDQRRRIAWREIIAGAVADSLGCKHYLDHNGRIVCFGRESATQTWNYTAMYLCAEIERLCDEGWNREGAAASAVGQTPKKWKNAFRVGAANTISTRLAMQSHVDKAKRKRQAQSPTIEFANSKGFEFDASTTAIGQHNTAALMLLERDEAEVATAYKKRSKGFVKSRGVGVTRSRSGYNAGQEAGRSVAIGAKRAGLGAGQARLK